MCVCVCFFVCVFVCACERVCVHVHGVRRQCVGLSVCECVCLWVGHQRERGLAEKEHVWNVHVYITIICVCSVKFVVCVTGHGEVRDENN